MKKLIALIATTLLTFTAIASDRTCGPGETVIAHLAGDDHIPTGDYPSQAAAIAAARAAIQPGSNCAGYGSYVWDNGTVTDYGGGNANIHFICSNPTGGIYTGASGNVSETCGPSICSSDGTSALYDVAATTKPASICIGACQYNATGPFMNFGGTTTHWVNNYTRTSTVCNSTTQNATLIPSDSPETINNVKIETSGSQYPCIKIDGLVTCNQDLLPTTPNQSKLLANGAAITNTTTPITAPDDGTAGEPATPAAGLGNETSSGASTNYYYTSTQVNHSTSGLDTNGDGLQDTRTNACGGPGKPSCPICGGVGQPSCLTCGGAGQPSCGTCGGAGQQPCNTPPTFGLSPPTDGESPSDSLAAYWTAIQGAPIVGAVTGIASSMPTGGDCPTATFDIAYINKTLTLDEHCVIAAQIKTVLHTIMLAAWFIVAVLILMSA